MSERQETKGGREWRDAQPQVLLDLRSVRVDQIGVYTGHVPLVVADAEAGIEKFSEADQIFHSKDSAMKIADVERQRILNATQVVEQHVVRIAAGFALR